MAMISDAPLTRDREADGLRFARDVLRSEADALDLVRSRLDATIAQAADLLFRCAGGVVVTGMGKAGLVGQKLAATLASTGTRAYTLHPAEAIHGDLGRIRPDDVVVALSQSGETDELTRILPTIRNLGAALVAITARSTSTLGRAADLCVTLGPIVEADPLGLAPTSSTTAMMAVGDALALLVSRMREFRAEDFAVFHPGGNLGRRLARVDDLMRSGRRLRVASDRSTVREVFVGLAGPRRRSGAVLVVDDAGRLSGIFTDSDLARLFEQRQDDRLDGPISAVMTADPLQVAAGSSVEEAVDLMKARKISELPVVDAVGRPVGLIDLTDLIDLVPAGWED